MMKFLLVTIMVFSMFGSASPNVVDDFKVSMLSKEGQNAYLSLSKTKAFNVEYVTGFAAIPKISPHVNDVNLHLKEENADAAFKSILKNGEIGGRLFALNGIYFTDYEYFKKAAENFRKSEEMVFQTNGCLIEAVSVSEIVFSYSENVAIIKPSQTLDDLEKDRANYVFDIANGGYPALIKSLSNRKDAENF